MLKDKQLRLSKIGSLKIVQHREIEGQIKTLTIRRDAELAKASYGNWYACFSCETPGHPQPSNEIAVGIDVGLLHFATLSSGEHIPHPRFFNQDEKALAKAQRTLSQVEKGTPERTKRRKLVAHIHQRIANRRKDFTHQLSRKWVDQYGVIAFEHLNIPGMLHNHSLAKSISDAAWNQLVRSCMYKAADADRAVVLVDPKGTSQRCSGCGTVVVKTLSDRVHACPACGLRLDRDENAALNILALGLESLGSIRRSRAASTAAE